MNLSWELVVQAIVAVVIITDPITRGFFFAALTKDEPQNRVKYVRSIAITVAVVLFVAALVGRQLLDIMGINLGAFGFVGGLIVAAMGLEMLAAQYGLVPAPKSALADLGVAAVVIAGGVWVVVAQVRGRRQAAR